MAIRFDASFLDISEVEGVTRILLSLDDNLEGEQYLMVQRQLAPSEKEVHFGMNDVYIETCGQGWSWYGHIDRFTLLPDRILVQLDATAASEIGDDGSIEVSFQLPPQRFATLQAALQRAFRDRAYYTEAAA